jgi:hypothetical protein
MEIHERMVQMIFNKRLDRIVEVEIVQNFMKAHQMQGKLCEAESTQSFILYRAPYAIVFWDAFIENYLEIVLVDMNSNLLLSEGSLTFCAVELGLQSREHLRALDFSNHMQLDIFLSHGASKMYGLYTGLDAIDKILPLVKSNGGLAATEIGASDSGMNFSALAKPVYQGLKQRLSKCIEGAVER